MPFPEFDDLPTEAGGDASIGYEDASTEELVRRMNALDAGVPAVVLAAASQIASAIDALVERMRAGGRLVYVGAGTSGWIGALDAAECESTFGTGPEQVVALVAGKDAPTSLERDAAEDDAGIGRDDIAALGIRSADAVVGLSASGRTPYVLGAIAEARRRGALTAGISSVLDSELARAVDYPIEAVVGAEFIAGSTRLKAGTAQKLVLNTISTVTMIRLGKTYGSMMVDVRATNEKLRARVHRIVRDATGADPEHVDRALAAADGNTKIAIVTLVAGLSPDDAKAALADSGGAVDGALKGQGQ